MKNALLMAALASLAAMPALAETGKDMDKKANMWFEKIDTNSDGQITKAEHDSFGNQMFAEADTDKNGNLSLEEMKAQKMKEKEEMKSGKENAR